MHPLLSSLADVILILHALIVLFNVGALPIIWVGHFYGWAFVRNFYFRIIHLLLIGLVATESLLGLMCPLTSWEDALRSGTAGDAVRQNSFIAYWLHQFLFYDFPGWVFTAVYLVFFALVALTFYWVRPHVPQFGVLN